MAGTVLLVEKQQSPKVISITDQKVQNPRKKDYKKTPQKFEAFSIRTFELRNQTFITHGNINRLAFSNLITQCNNVFVWTQVMSNTI